MSTLRSVVIFLFFSWVLTSARNSSPFFVPDDVIACAMIKKRKGQQLIKKSNELTTKLNQFKLKTDKTLKIEKTTSLYSSTTAIIRKQK